MSRDEPGDIPQDLRDRLRRVEESQAFAEQSSEALTGQMLEIDRRLRDLMTRLTRIESRLIDVAARLEEPGGEDTSDVPNRDD